MKSGFHSLSGDIPVIPRSYFRFPVQTPDPMASTKAVLSDIDEVNQWIEEQLKAESESRKLRSKKKVVQTKKTVAHSSDKETGNVSIPAQSSVPVDTSLAISAVVIEKVPEGDKSRGSSGKSSGDGGFKSGGVAGGSTSHAKINEPTEGGLVDSPSETVGKVITDRGNSEVEKVPESPSTEALNQLAKMSDIAAVMVNSSSEDDETPLVRLSSRKRKAESEPRRRQPLRSGKKDKSSAEKPNKMKVQKLQASGVSEKSKSVLDEFKIDKEFLLENQLEEVYELIKFQGWVHLFEEDVPVDKDLVLEFYNTVSKVEKGNVVYLNFELKGQELTVSSRDLAYDLSLSHEGFDTFTKRHWPESVTEQEKKEMEERVCGYSDLNVTDLTTLYMEPKVKILHRLLVHSILPRGSKPAIAQIQDILVLDQVMRKQKVNLPKLIIHQMEYVSNLQHVGHARFVRNILYFQDLYKPKTEVSVLKPLTLHSIHRWGIVLDKEHGWVRKQVLTDEAAEAVKGGSDTATLKLSDDKLDRIEEKITDLRKDLDKIATNVWMIEDEFSGFKVLIEEGFAEMRRIMASGFGSKT